VSGDAPPNEEVNDMAVMSVSVVTVKPGRFEDFVKLQRKAEALLKNAGAKNLRFDRWAERG
jgi:hypothetical protein